MRTVEEYREILTLWGEGESKKAIARITGIPRCTIIDCIRRYGDLTGLEEALVEKASQGKGDAGTVVGWLLGRSADVHQAYTYLLGLYLGDGTISRAGRTTKLRVFLDSHYPGIIRSCSEAMEALFPDKRAGIVVRSSWQEVYMLYNHWPVLFPQHGKGLKHLRPIALADWQESFAEAYPLDLLRGLYHSDGSRSRNFVNGKDYPRYLFTNESPGIRRIFSETCDRLGLHWTIANRRNVCVSRRPDVARLDILLGPKA